MTRPYRSLLALSLIAGLGAFPVAAQEQEDPQFNSGAASSGERIKQVIVYGDDPCTVGSNPNEIVVCVRQKEEERYRIPPNLRDNPNSPEAQSWTQRAQAIEYVGRSGTNSCSPVGAGGFTGCFAQIARQAKEERQMMDATSWADLVAEERARRLGTIDADSEEIEARVKAEEAARKAQQDSEAPSAPQP